MKNKTIKAYWFCDENLRLQYNDNRNVAVGITHTVDCIPVLCDQGLHASRSIIDALKYAPGAVLCEVEIGGEIVEGEDKIAGQKRKYLSVKNVESELRLFARRQALINIEKIKPYCTETDFNLIKKYLISGEEKLRAAAWAVAWTAAESASRASSRAARASAKASAWSSAQEAAEAARASAKASARASAEAAEAAEAAAQEAARASAEAAEAAAKASAWASAQEAEAAEAAAWASESAAWAAGAAASAESRAAAWTAAWANAEKMLQEIIYEKGELEK